ncbi:MAG: DUF2497 domain-containing protein [Proteobacteria bacterium]|nr:DUF2497 domain-containing protein [Pseudomonadota bacterium]MBI3495983.1 DUF2497 domain-containing protein [Pseudomonadota bacterium]
MSDPKSQEPSMEEILASIRRIISEDGAGEGEAAAAAPAAAAPAEAPKPAPKPAAAAPKPEPKPEPKAEAPPPPPEPAPQEDVLELTDVVEEDGSIVNLSKPVPEAPPEPEGAPEPLFAEQRTRGRAPPPAPERTLEGLVSPPVRAEAIGHFTDLADALHRPETPIGAGYKTLEEMTKEVMRPMLKEWLDSHLPDLVERLVQEEIERMVHKATRRQ